MGSKSPLRTRASQRIGSTMNVVVAAVFIGIATVLTVAFILYHLA